MTEYAVDPCPSLRRTSARFGKEAFPLQVMLQGVLYLSYTRPCISCLVGECEAGFSLTREKQV